MKILSLKAKNINSLKGSTKIDFEKLTKDSSLFAITGATGSGKSTLLDIISCALYGRTARLKNPNDLMSKHTGEAICEVEFEVKGKRYRSSWTQRRARNKHDGKFQTAKMELTDLEENKILPLKSKEVPKKVEELSGLDFGRFTQSMLLAQGGFDAFLKADEKERSALLEKITATQIYAEISKAIFEKHKKYEQEINSDEKVLDSMELLDQEIVKQKQQELLKNEEDKKVTNKQLENVSLSINWLEKVLELSKKYDEYTTKLNEATKQKEDNKPSFEKLFLANKALNISPTFTSYKQFQKNVTENKTTFLKISADIKKLEEDIKIKSENYTKVKKEFEKVKDEFEIQTKKLKQARELQTKEEETTLVLNKETKLLKTKKDTLNNLENTLTTLLKKHKDIQNQLDEKNNYLTTCSKDKELITVLGVLEQNIKEYKKEILTLKTSKEKLEILKDKLLVQEKDFTTKQEEVVLLSNISQKNQLAYEKIVQTTKNEFEEEQKTQTLLRLVKSYKELLKNKNEELKEYKKNSTLVVGFEEKRTVLQDYISKIKTHIDTLREKQEREQLLKKYEQDRNLLVDGEPCLLCGSKTHPFAKKEVEDFLDETKKVLKDELKELDEQEKELRQLEQNISIAQTKKENSNLKKVEEELRNIEEHFKQSSFLLTDTSENELTKKLETIKQNRTLKESLLQQRDDSYKDFQAKEKELTKIKSSLQNIEKEKEYLDTHIKSTHIKIEELTHFIKLHVENFNIENIDTQYENLLRKKELYVKTTENVKSLEDELNTILINKKENETNISLTKKDIASIEKELKILQKSLDELSTKRVKLLNVANLDVYEQEIVKNYELLQEKEQFAKTILNELHVKKEERQTNKNTLQTKIQTDEKRVEKLEKELENLYKENSFKDEKEFEKALIDKDEKESLETLCKDIEYNYKKVEILKLNTLNQLQELQKAPLTNKPLEELTELQQSLKQKNDELLKSSASLNKELDINQEKSKNFQEKIVLLEKKKEAFKVWVKLNELVGSADGTKFKKFAQGITLDQLIALANKHLNILSSRYTLARNKEKLLELEVVDGYQGDVVRPVSTLSGGESFIVSLALALGLSELASQKISIDSLFLDEGFGTLDEESLQTALNALNLLQNRGKMVGVISHVEALKERIPQQIKVVPNGDGTSSVKVIEV